MTPKKPLSAVAVKYNHKTDTAPRVVAKGQRALAERIIALAHQHAIPLREDPVLVEALYQLEIQQEVPPELYRAMAEVLAYIYRLDRLEPGAGKKSG
jgi:flagellar biosynthesis protein